MKRIYMFLFLLGAFCLSACTTNVGVESSNHPVGIYSSLSGNFKGLVDGDMMSVFKATNKALDTLGYERTAQKVREKSATVIARAVLDPKIRVDIEPRADNVVKVVINFDGGNLLKSQEIFNLITRFAKSTSM